MSRRPGAAALLLVLACGRGEAPPNLVLIIGDDHGYPDFGFMGSDTVRAPRLDELAAEGVVFPAGYSTASLCRPALRTLLTGLEPIQYTRLQREAREAGWPGTFEGGSVRDALVSINDVVPTLLDFAGARPLRESSGHSLRPLLEGREDWPRTAFIDTMHVVRTDAPSIRMGGFFWRDARWHYLEPAQRSPELYDLEADPQETRNVAKQHPEVVVRARAEIRAWSSTLGRAPRATE